MSSPITVVLSSELFNNPHFQHWTRTIFISNINLTHQKPPASFLQLKKSKDLSNPAYKCRLSCRFIILASGGLVYQQCLSMKMLCSPSSLYSVFIQVLHKVPTSLDLGLYQ